VWTRERSQVHPPQTTTAILLPTSLNPVSLDT
jgi:hypothetical protein